MTLMFAHFSLTAEEQRSALTVKIIEVEVHRSICSRQSIAKRFFLMRWRMLVSVNRAGTVKIFSHALRVNWLRA